MTEAHKLVRTNDPITSHLASESIDPNRLEKIVLEVINSFGEEGCISDDVLEKLPQLRYSSVTARYKGLQEKFLIYKDGTKAKGRSGRQQEVMWGWNYYPHSISI
tara:strand:- start:774 stop:1088 length:315 start_codon:yes stop_codon:yes gene_type:complete